MFAGGVLSWLVLPSASVDPRELHHRAASTDSSELREQSGNGQPLLISEMSPSNCGAPTSVTSAQAPSSRPD